MTTTTVMTTSAKEDIRDKDTSKKGSTSMTSILRYLLSLCTSVLHGSRAETTSLQSLQMEERKGTSCKDTTSREETTTPTSHLGLQCSYNVGALQHHYHYDWCTSCDLEDDIKEEEDILATCPRRHQRWRVLHAKPPTTMSTNTYNFRWNNTYIPRVGSQTSSLPPHWSIPAHRPFGLRLRCGATYYNRHHGAADTSWT